MTKTRSGADEDEQEGPGRRRTPLWKKGLLALVTLTLLVVVLEVAASLVVPHWGPRRLRDGVYVNLLPLSTGLIQARFDVLPLRLEDPLPEDKPAGQIRIFVFGESSVAGSPYGSECAAPAQLHDLLAEELPDRDVVVVNMGRPGSVIPNTYYHLLAIEPYRPDYVIFYLGANDGTHFAGEECAALEHPTLHGAWRWMVERLDFVWATRVFGPALLWSSPSDSPGQARCSASPFAMWADLVVRRAQQMGARVIATSPARSWAYVMEPGGGASGGRDPFEVLDEPYLRLLACRLDESCDFQARFEQALGALPASRDPASFAATLDTLSAAWRDAAAAHGADFVDFRALLERASPRGRMLDEMFSDEIHLDLRGYGFLARAWLEALRPHLGAGPATEPRPPVREGLEPYAARAEQDPMGILRSYLRRGWLLSTVPGLEDAAASCWGGDCTFRDQARAALEWLRWRAAVGPAPDEATRARLERFQADLLSGELDRLAKR